MKGIVFIDLDGTLLNSEWQISERNKAAVSKVQGLGYEVVLCTARAITNSLDYAEQIGCNYIVYASGNVYDVREQKSLYINTMDPEEAIQIYRMASRPDTYVMFTCTYGHRYSSQPRPTDAPSQYRINVIAGDTEQWIRGEGIVQIMVVARDPSVLIRLRGQCLPLLNNLRLSEQSKCLHDLNESPEKYPHIGFSSKTSSKGNGVVKLCEVLENKGLCGETQRVSYPRSKRIAIGDCYNDIAMFAECSFNVAMGNALPQLRQKATVITDTNDNDGVAKFLETLN